MNEFRLEDFEKALNTWDFEVFKKKAGELTIAFKKYNKQVFELVGEIGDYRICVSAGGTSYETYNISVREIMKLKDLDSVTFIQVLRLMGNKKLFVKSYECE